MSASSEPPHSNSSPATPRAWDTWITVATVVIFLGAMGVVLWLTFVNAPPTSPTSTVTTTVTTIAYPVGTADLAAPSGLAPPGAKVLPGYTLSYVTDFDGTVVPAGWGRFSGVPMGDPQGQFGSAHAVVRGGLLRLNTWRDPAYRNKWVTGGVSQDSVARIYGAYFVRSRVTGFGPNEIEMLWPASDVWPPEVDFNEAGKSNTGSTATVHWGTLDYIEQHSIHIDLTKWHTWGVVWTPTALRYVVDGREWAAVTTAAAIPRVPMTLDLEQRAMCTFGFDCPTAPVSMLVDWVAEYIPSPPALP